MYFRFCVAVVFTTLLAFAQMYEGRGQVGSYRARIVPEDGTELPHDPLIIIQPGQNSGCTVHQVFGNGNILYSAWTYDRTTTTDECSVEIRVEGFRNKKVVLRDGAIIPLKRIGESEGVTTPASSLNAPKNAAKEYGKGVADLRKKKYESAAAHLQAAVDLYPEYAQAYSDLGEALEQQHKNAEARNAYEKSLALSPKYLKPYAQLARLSVTEEKYRDAIDISERAIKLNAIDFPSIYYYRAVAFSKLGQQAQAEESAKQAVDLDVDHQVPLAPFLFGTILEKKGDREGAIDAFQKYVKQTPKPADAAEVSERIRDLKAASAAK